MNKENCENSENKEVKILNLRTTNPSFLETFKMNLYLIMKSANFTCCVNNNKLTYYKNVENEFKSKLNFENWNIKMLSYDKINNFLFNEYQLNFFNSY